MKNKNIVDFYEMKFNIPTMSCLLCEFDAKGQYFAVIL